MKHSSISVQTRMSTPNSSIIFKEFVIMARIPKALYDYVDKPYNLRDLFSIIIKQTEQTNQKLIVLNLVQLLL